MYNLSTCVFIKDTFTGAFCLFESVASLLHLTDEFLIMDLGSTDGTLETLREIEAVNPKVKVIQGGWPVQDPRAFAILANDLVRRCSNERVLYYQADEIWHENLLQLMESKFQQGNFDLSFWRLQYRENFQIVNWYPHLVHRVGIKGPTFYFAEKDDDPPAVNKDGMNTTRVWDAKICSNYGGEWFPKWGGFKDTDPTTLPTHEMITDISLVGGFRDNIIERRALHAPMWHEEPTIERIPASHWRTREEANPNWTKTESPFNLPHILRGLVGKTRYELRPEVLAAIKENRTRELLGL